MFSDTTIKIGEVGVKVVIDLEFAGRFMKENPATAAENFDIPVAFSIEADDDLVTQGFLSAHPAHKTVHAFLSGELRKRAVSRACFRNTALYFLFVRTESYRYHNLRS